jgi:hypothetical protein
MRPWRAHVWAEFVLALAWAAALLLQALVSARVPILLARHPRCL